MPTSSLFFRPTQTFAGLSSVRKTPTPGVLVGVFVGVEVALGVFVAVEELVGVIVAVRVNVGVLVGV